MSRVRKGWFTAFISPETWRESGQAACESLRAQMEVRAKQLRYEGARSQEEERRLNEELNTVGTEPEFTLRLKHLYGWFWALGFILTVLGTIGLALWALRPFGLRWEGYLVAAVVTVIAAFGMAVVMDQLSHLVSEPSYRRFILFLGVAGLFGAVTASTFLGVVRSKEMAVQGTLSRQDNPAVIIEGEGPAPDQGQQDATPSPLKDFYEKLGALSLLVMIPLAVAVELVGGIALHEALARIPPARTKLKLLRRRRRLQRQIVACASAIVACEQQPEIAWNEFLQGGLQGEQMRRQLQAQPGRLFVIGLMFLFLVFFFGLVWAAKSFAEEAVVVGVDLTKSSDEELAKNLQAVDSIILSLKSGSRFIVLPITDRSFSQPAILDARLSADPGLFGERLRAEKQQVMRKWRERSKVLKADAKGSDLFGALAKASILFDESPGPKPVLILLSDMRHVGRGYNFEALTKIERALLEQVQKEGLIPSLKGVKVWVLGAHAQGVSEVYWMSLRAFWAEYLKRAGAELITFSPNRRWQR